MKKHPFIRSLVKKLKAIPSYHLIDMIDYWDEVEALNLKRGKKLVYVSVLAYDKEKTPRYDYDLEINFGMDDPNDSSHGSCYVTVQEVYNVSQDEVISAVKTLLDI